MRNISISQPVIGEDEKAAVMRVLDSGHLVQGSEVARFEAAFAAYCGVQYAVATSSGTTALTTALLACGVGQGDEVIIPAFSFVATATSVLAAGAKPIFVDIEDKTFCMETEQVERAITPRTRVIMPVHLFGHPANIAALQPLVATYGLRLIEDSAQAHGAEYQGQRSGSLGDAGAFSFYASKNMMTAEGGILTTNDEVLAARARMARNHGMNTQYYHEIIGFNYRMTDICAAIGVVQITSLESWTLQRIKNAAYLSANLRTVRAPITQPEHRHAFHQYTVLVSEGADRDAMVAQLNQRGIGARIYYPTPIHRQPMFQQMDCQDVHLPVTEAMCRRVFSLPVHQGLTQDDLDYMVAEVNAL